MTDLAATRYTFESTVNAVATENQEDAESLAPSSEFDIQTDGSRTNAGGGTGQPSLQELLESAQNLSHRTVTTHPIEGRHFIFLFYYFFLSCDLHVPVDLVL